MLNEPERERAIPKARWAWLLSVSLLWAAGIAVSPWLPELMGAVDLLEGLYILVSMAAWGVAPSLLLGGFLGHAHACRLLATCSAVAPCLWIVDWTIMSAPGTHSFRAWAAIPAFALVCALTLVVTPLVGGAAAGRCYRLRLARLNEGGNGRAAKTS